jgi:hypothetical protein
VRRPPCAGFRRNALQRGASCRRTRNLTVGALRQPHLAWDPVFDPWFYAVRGSRVPEYALRREVDHDTAATNVRGALWRDANVASDAHAIEPV